MFTETPTISPDERLAIKSADSGAVTYVDFDLKTAGKCTTAMCTSTPAHVAFEGMDGLDAVYHHVQEEDRHAFKLTSQTGTQ